MLQFIQESKVDPPGGCRLIVTPEEGRKLPSWLPVSDRVASGRVVFSDQVCPAEYSRLPRES
tara:strand:- start:549 stop:734 length:186 start_codon:yes stop_codon:yes gene_type:complete